MFIHEDVIVTIDMKRFEAIYPNWFTKFHTHAHCDNRCLYEDGRGITRCSYFETFVDDVRKSQSEGYPVHLGCGGECDVILHGADVTFCRRCDSFIQVNMAVRTLY